MKTYLVMVDRSCCVAIQAEEALVDIQHNVVNFVTADESGLMQTVGQWNVGDIIGWMEMGKPS